MLFVEKVTLFVFLPKNGHKGTSLNYLHSGKNRQSKIVSYTYASELLLMHYTRDSVIWTLDLSTCAHNFTHGE